MTSFFTESLPVGVTNRTIEHKTVDPDQQNIRIFVNGFYFYLLGVIIPLGLLCNAFCVLVCALSVGLRRTSTGHYLMALAIADSLFLSADLVRWMNTTSAREASPKLSDLMHTSRVVCKLIYYIRYSAKLTSAWITVSIVIERLIAVALPLKVSLVSTTRRAKMVVCLITLCGLGLSSFPFWTVSVIQNQHGLWRCLVIKSHYNAYHYWNTAVIRVGALALPGVILTVCTTIIVVMLTGASHRRFKRIGKQTSLSSGRCVSLIVEKSRQTGSVSELVRNSRQSLVVKLRPPPEHQLSAMLVGVCVAFVCLRLPYTIAYYLHEYRNELWGPSLDSATETRLHAAKQITDVIATSNYVVNFFLYSLCGSYFRQQIVTAFRCRHRRSGTDRWNRASTERFRRSTMSSHTVSSDTKQAGSLQSEHINMVRQFTPRNSLQATVYRHFSKSAESMVTPTSISESNVSKVGISGVERRLCSSFENVDEYSNDNVLAKNNYDEGSSRTIT